VGFADYVVDVPATEVQIHASGRDAISVRLVCADVYEFESFLDLVRGEKSERFQDAQLASGSATLHCPGERRWMGGRYVIVPFGPPRDAERRTYFIRFDHRPDIYRVRTFRSADGAIGLVPGPDHPPPGTYDFTKDGNKIGVPGSLDRFHRYVELEQKYYESAGWHETHGLNIAVSADGSKVWLDVGLMPRQ
jgi:hypothetical protein